VLRAANEREKDSRGDRASSREVVPPGLVVRLGSARPA